MVQDGEILEPGMWKYGDYVFRVESLKIYYYGVNSLWKAKNTTKDSIILTSAYIRLQGGEIGKNFRNFLLDPILRGDI